MPSPRLDGTITFGNILSLMGFLIAGLMAYSAMAAEMRVLQAELVNQSSRIEAINQQTQRMTDVLVRDAQREAAIHELRRRLEVLERLKD